MATSKLQRRVSNLISTHLGQYTTRENYRPCWLSFERGRLELDFYIDELKTAIEIQGMQHYAYVPFFHSNKDGFARQVKRDKAKAIMCQNHGVQLFAIDTLDDALALILTLAGKAHNYHVHQNALAQACKAELSKKLVFDCYPKTVAKHLKRLYKNLKKHRLGVDNNALRRSVRLSIRAIEQYQEEKSVKLDIQAITLIETAKDIL